MLKRHEGRLVLLADDTPSSSSYYSFCSCSAETENSIHASSVYFVEEDFTARDRHWEIFSLQKILSVWKSMEGGK
jgi:hypothetical protein